MPDFISWLVPVSMSTKTNDLLQQFVHFNVKVKAVIFVRCPMSSPNACKWIHHFVELMEAVQD